MDLVGRDALLAWGDAIFDNAIAGRGRLLLLGGEAGVGKTALARATAERADGRAPLSPESLALDEGPDLRSDTLPTLGANGRMDLDSPDRMGP